MSFIQGSVGTLETLKSINAAARRDISSFSPRNIDCKFHPVAAALSIVVIVTSSFEIKTLREEESTPFPGSLPQQLIRRSVKNITSNK